MIVLTVKTLDSQNHSFTVDENITVAEFKVKIAESINIPAETQRIIYCGRVLQDNSKLSEYDVDGKVVHLVQRAPPSTTSQSNRSPSPPTVPRRVFRGFDHGNAMYLGSMAFPSNLMESQGIAPPPPTHTLSGSRLNVAKRMLRRAEAVIRSLENPTNRSNEQTPPEEQQDEEITPIIEARVIVPSNDSDNIDEDMVLSAVRNTILNAAELSTAPLNVNPSSQNATDNTASAGRSASTSPEETTPVNTSQENLLADQSSSDNSNTRPSNTRTRRDNASRTSEMAELLTMLNQLQTRFAPFLERYHTFMVEDPVVTSEAVRQTQTMLNRVSEVLHYLGHAYHSLSDIMIRVRTSPPRPLLCRPILIQHSAVVQAGIPIPIQVEVHREQNNVSSNSTVNQTTTTNTVSDGDASTTATTNSENRPNITLTGSNVTAHIQPTVVQFPLVHAASMRLQSFPLEFRSGQRGNNLSSQRSQNNGNSSVNGTQNVSTTATTVANASAASVSSDAVGVTATSTATTSASRPSGSDNGFNLSNFNNSNVEFVMEFTPEGITIDSLETMPIGSNQVNDLIRGNQPDVLQSLLQTANWYMNLSNGAASTTSTRTTTTQSNVTSQSNITSSTADLNQSTSNNVTSQATGGQNSQARGNTQTNPTTSTHTRSTPRPHVHLAQQAMQGGFDPFLPCNSHHVTHRRQRVQTQMANQQNSSQNMPRSNTTRTQNNSNNQNFTSMVDGLMNTIRNVAFAHINNIQEPNTTNTSSSSATATSSNSNISSTNNANSTSTTSPRPTMNIGVNLANFRDSLRGLSDDHIFPTMAQFLPTNESSVPEGESLINDLVMIFSRNLGIIDMLDIHAGNLDSLNRVTSQMSAFFTSRVLNGENTSEAIDRGVDLIINEMRPFFGHFERLNVRNNIDIVRSLELLFRVKLSEVVRTAANLNSNNIRLFVDQCLSIAQYMCTLILHASSNGMPGVEAIFQDIITSYTETLPGELRTWAVQTVSVNLRQFMENLTISPESIEPYLVLRDVLMPLEPEINSTIPNSEGIEPMELDIQMPETSSENEAELLSRTTIQDNDELPSVVIGSESWHNQVPEEWVPIITKDVQRQRRQNPQGPFSDAYLSGMPSKRRKIVNSSKPQGSLPHVIAESVKRAVTATGLASVAPLDTIAQAAGASSEIQTAYRNLLRTNVQANIKNNEDFTSERFPNASNYFTEPE